jgi:DNA-binding transcriptional ArsR family regulator
MQDNKILSGPGWRIGESICLELDIALSAVAGHFEESILPEDLFGFLQSIPTNWKSELRTLLGVTHGFYSILESLGFLAGVLTVRDYGQATLAIRELNVQSAIDLLANLAAELGIEPVEGLDPLLCLIELYVRIRLAAYQAVGFNMSMDDIQAIEMRHDIEKAALTLYGEELHTRFWHWMDRFFYEAYHPWRLAHQDTVEQAVQRASGVLGASQKTGAPPELSWLPAQNPILRFPELTAAVKSGKIQVYFFSQPFGLSDVWSLTPGLLICSFAEPGVLYQNFLAYSRDLARRAQAIADPTRLVILRIIRYFGMDNTEIAAYLGLARPTVSIHARILREAGLIHSHADGRAVRHEIDGGEVRRLFQDLENFLALPDEPHPD